MAKKITTATKKPSKKAAPKISVKTKTQVQSLALEKPVQIAKPKSLKLRKSHMILIGVILLAGVLLYFGRGLFVAAVVNGQPISRISVVKEAEKQSGKQSLETLVRNALIEQEARKANITVSDKEIDEEIKKVEATLEKQGQKLDQVLTMQGMTRQDLRKLIRLDKLVGKIVGKDVKVTDKEVADYIAANKDSLPENQKEDELKKSVEDRLKQQKLNEKVRVWLEDLQKKAKVMYFVQY